MLDIARLLPEKQFDFWLGAWDVSWGDGQHGANHITRILKARAIQENFDGRPSMAFRGMSLSVYSRKLGQWQQTWVDTDGNYWHFLGGVDGDQMILSTQDVIDGQPIRLRMVFYDIARDTLEWRWERSGDGGQTWQVKWQIHYQRKDD
jgi:hypothetical protein